MMRGGLVLIFFGLFWSGMTLLFDSFIILPAARQAWTIRYASTEGAILSSEVIWREGEDGKYPVAKFRYKYTVDGREFTGRRFRHGGMTSSGCGWVQDAVAARAAGTKVTVYYDPWRPADSVLSPGLIGSDLFFVMFMTPFNAVMFAFFAVGWLSLWRKCFGKPPAGGVKLVTRLRQTRARLTGYPPVTTAIATSALLAFLGVFVVLVTAGDQPSLRTMILAWSVILGGGILAACWHGINILRGQYDLILDERQSLWLLPLTHGRKTRLRIPLATVQSLFVETIEKKDSEGSATFTYIPSVRFGTGHQEKVEPLAEWHDETKAREFIAWLQKKIPLRESLKREN